MPPPLPCLIGLITGVGLYLIFPLSFPSRIVTVVLGVIGVVVVVALSVAMSRAFDRHNTSANPKSETTAIVDTGPFKYSRNPAYLTVGILQVAIGLLLNNVWVVVLTAPALIAIHMMVVKKEERYLEDKFGNEYLQYKSRVRPWI